MEPVLQFDPANLSIWYSYLHSREDNPIDQIARTALLGDQGAAKDLVENLKDHEAMLRGAHMLSAVCHEQRHFVDVLLTNFGQGVFRQFAPLMVHVPALRAEAAKEGVLALPISVYEDEVRREILGVQGGEQLRRAGYDARSRIQMAKLDEIQHSVPGGGHLSIGGRAQLEALGFMTQVGVLQSEFGGAVSRSVQVSMPDGTRMRNQYGWAAILASALGLTPEDSAPDAFTALGAPLSALLYGALMVRRWAQKDSDTAADRLNKLVFHVRDTKKLARAGSTKEAWEVVNAACGELFGRSAEEELEQDLAHEESYCDQIRGVVADVFPFGSAFLDGVHEARVRLAALFVKSPELFLDPFGYGNLLAAVDPVPVFVVATARTEEPEEGYTALWKGSEGPISWHWASAPTTQIAEGGRVHILKDVEAWRLIVASIIPVVKLMLWGMRQASVLGLELMYGETVLKGDGLELRYDPSYAQPSPDTSSEGYWYLYRRESALCDGCGATLPRGTGHYIPAIVFRNNDKTIAWLIKHYGGGEVGRLREKMDWSGWLLCDGCKAEIEQLLQPAAVN